MRSVPRHAALAVTMLLTIVLVGAIAYAQDVPASPGFSISVSPPKSELTLSAGEETIASVVVGNPSGRPIDITAEIKDFKVTDAHGAVTLLDPDPSYSAGLGRSMVLLTPATFTLGGKEQREINLRITVPESVASGALFGAVTFATGAPREQGKVNIVSQVASLLVVHVRGVSVANLPTPQARMVFDAPVEAPAGVIVRQVHDPQSDFTVQMEGSTTRISFPIADESNTVQGMMSATSKTGLIGTGTAARAELDRLEVHGHAWSVDLGKGSPAGAQTARIQLSFQLNTVPTNAAVRADVSATPTQAEKDALAAVAHANTVKDVAYVLEVGKRNVQDGYALVNAVLQLGVDRAWAEKNDPSLVRVVRHADDGSVQVLSTTFLGFDGDLALFEARSPGGLSAFLLTAFTLPQLATQLPANTVRPFSAPTSPPAAATFTLLLAPARVLTANAVALDDGGHPLRVSASGALTVHTTVVQAPMPPVRLQPPATGRTGLLRWFRVPGVVGAGHNTLTLQFEDTSTTDYAVQPGLVRVVSMDGKDVALLQLTDFNAFPGSTRTLTVDWVTPTQAFGRYTASAQISFGVPPVIVTTEPVSVWVIPWKWILSLLLVAGGLFALVLVILRSARKEIEKQVERRLSESRTPPRSHPAAGGSPQGMTPAAADGPAPSPPAARDPASAEAAPRGAAAPPAPRPGTAPEGAAGTVAGLGTPATQEGPRMPNSDRAPGKADA